MADAQTRQAFHIGILDFEIFEDTDAFYAETEGKFKMAAEKTPQHLEKYWKK